MKDSFESFDIQKLIDFIKQSFVVFVITCLLCLNSLNFTSFKNLFAVFLLTCSHLKLLPTAIYWSCTSELQAVVHVVLLFLVLSAPTVCHRH